MSVRILFLKEDMTDIFCEFLAIKEPQTTLENKETTVQSYQKMSNQNTKNRPKGEFSLFNYTGEMGMDNFGWLISSLSFFLSVTNLRKKNYDVRTLTGEPSFCLQVYSSFGFAFISHFLFAILCRLFLNVMYIYRLVCSLFFFNYLHCVFGKYIVSR